ncbi:hypothetical protein K438DRAFT_1846325 [Mycena galopus ATCC 62051]|nr:hypothetical protein K438DRAFT_1846325 [Mycena galopus ATCC 62051]
MLVCGWKPPVLAPAYILFAEHADSCQLSYPCRTTIPTIMSSNLGPTPSALRLSERDAQILKIYGSDIIHSVVVNITSSIFCSVYGIFFALAVYSIFRKGFRSRSSIIMLFVVVYLYASSVTLWAMLIFDCFRGIHSVLMVPNVPIPERINLAEETVAFDTMGEALWVFNMLVGDSVVLWRTWAVYQGRILVVLIPCFLLLISFVFGLVDIICEGLDEAIPGGERICQQPEMISWAFSIGTNLACTILIWCEAWRHRKAMREFNMPGKHQERSTEKVLSLLVESGFVYSLLWLSHVTVYIEMPNSLPWTYVQSILGAMAAQIAGLYPTLVIVMVNFGLTIWNEAPTAVDKSGQHNSAQSVANAMRGGPTHTFGAKRGVNIDCESVIDIRA